MTFPGRAAVPGPAEYPPPPLAAAATPAVPSRWRRGELRRLAILLGGQLIAGIAIGLIWLAWSPRAVVFLVPGSGKGVARIPDESEGQIAGDGRYLVLCVLVGLVVGSLAWFLLRSLRGLVPLFAVAVTGLLSSLLAAALGHELSPGSDTGPLGTAIQPPLSLHSPTMLLAQSFVAVLVYIVLTGLHDDPTLRGESGVRRQPSLQSNP